MADLIPVRVPIVVNGRRVRADVRPSPYRRGQLDVTLPGAAEPVGSFTPAALRTMAEAARDG